jgi:hypothetical protein
MQTWKQINSCLMIVELIKKTHTINVTEFFKKILTIILRSKPINILVFKQQ